MLGMEVCMMFPYAIHITLIIYTIAVKIKVQYAVVLLFCKILVFELAIYCDNLTSKAVLLVFGDV